MKRMTDPNEKFFRSDENFTCSTFAAKTERNGTQRNSLLPDERIFAPSIQKQDSKQCLSNIMLQKIQTLVVGCRFQQDFFVPVQQIKRRHGLQIV